MASTADENGKAFGPLETGTAKAFKKIIPIIMVMFIVNYIDRVNIGYAKDALAADSGIGAAAFGLGAGLFFVSYAVFEIPSNLLLEKFGAKFWLTRIMISWGIVSALMVFAHSEMIFYILRLALGAAEAGFFAGVIYYFTQWFHNSARGRANAALYSASAIAAVIAGPLSGSLLSMHGFLGMRGWQWMFLIEGGAAIIIGFIVWRFLVSHPSHAKWLTDEEKRAILAKLEAEEIENSNGSTKTVSRWSLLADPQILLFCFIYFSAQLAQYSVSFWLPSFVREIGGLSEMGIGLIAVIPYVFAFVAIIVAGRISDKTGLRRTVLGSGLFLAVIGLTLAAFASPLLAVLMLVIATVGFKIAASSFFVIPQKYLIGVLAAPGIALINSVGNLGGFVAPTLLGQIQEKTGDTSAGLVIIAAFCVIAMVGCIFLRTTAKKEQPKIQTVDAA